MSDSPVIARVRHHPVLAVVILALGLVNIVLNVLVESWIWVAFGALLTVVGIGQLLGSAVVITRDEVQVKNNLNMTIKSFPHRDLTGVRLDGPELTVRGERAIRFSPLVRKGDVEALRQMIDGAARAQGR